MKKIGFIAATIALLTGSLFGAAPLFPNPSESSWSVMSGKTNVATVTQITDGRSSRVEWTPSAGTAPIVFIGTAGKIWVRTPSAPTDLELDSYKGGIERMIAPALLLPITSTAADDIDTAGGKVTAYEFTGSRASYKHDAKGALSVDVKAGGQTYSLLRTAVKAGGKEPTLYVARPRKGAATRLARLSGDLFAPSKGNVAATAGGRGVQQKGFKFADGGDYSALEKLETRDKEWKPRLARALEEFQKEGKVGEGRQ